MEVWHALQDESGSVEEDGESGGESEEEHEHVHHHDPRRAPHRAGPVKKAAAALSVGVGSLSDPWELQVRAWEAQGLDRAALHAGQGRSGTCCAAAAAASQTHVAADPQQRPACLHSAGSAPPGRLHERALLSPAPATRG